APPAAAPRSWRVAARASSAACTRTPAGSDRPDPGRSSPPRLSTALRRTDRHCQWSALPWHVRPGCGLAAGPERGTVTAVDEAEPDPSALARALTVLKLTFDTRWTRRGGKEQIMAYRNAERLMLRAEAELNQVTADHPPESAFLHAHMAALRAAAAVVEVAGPMTAGRARRRVRSVWEQLAEVPEARQVPETRQGPEPPEAI